jgi:NAD(P)-dependent dehydrogenase (short-subunit alcohol dehydrogenase family)
VVNDIDAERAAAVAGAITTAGGRARAVGADVSDPGAVAELFAVAGAVDVLVNNVGVSHDAMPMEQIPLAELDRVVNVNLHSIVLCCRAALPSMTAAGWGRIVNVASRTWLGAAGLSFYSATKGGVISFSRSLALEVGRLGVTVNVIAPGTIRSPAFDRMPPDRIDGLLDRNPARRFGQPADVGRAARFLASPQSRAITGLVLHVCGGRSLYGGAASALSGSEV